MTYLSGTARSFIAKAESTWGMAAGTGSAKKFRRSQIVLNLRKDRYADDEIRDDMQKTLSSSGGERVEGTLDCGLSCGSHQEFIEALLRRAATATANLTGLSVTVAGAGPTYTLTRGSGSYITDGIRVGMVIRATAALGAGNLNRNLAVTAVSALVATVYPLDGAAMTAEGPTAAVTLTVPGKRTFVPSSGHIERSFTMEDALSATLGRQFLGVEVTSGSFDVSPGQNAKANLAFLGRSMTKLTSAYFVSPTALSTRRRLSGPRGIILIDGVVQAVLTQLNFACNGNLSVEPVIGTTAAAAIGQGSLVGTGNGQLLITDGSFIDRYLNDTPFEVLCYLQETANDPDSDFMAFHLPACQQNSADIDDGEKLLKLGFPFEFAKKETATGYEETTIAVQDSQYV